MPRAKAQRNSSPLPGLGLSLGITIFWLSFIVLVPLAAVFARSWVGGWDQFLAAAGSPRALASYRLTFGAALVAAAVNSVFGLLVAWVLVRYDFPFKRLFGALIDLPFALPTAVAGIALTALYADTGLIGRQLAPLGFPIAYKPAGVVVFSEMIVDQSTGTVTLRARIPNPQGELLPGMFVQALFTQGVQANAFLVPQAAVQRDIGGDAFVWIVGARNKAERRKVVTTRTFGPNWVVTAGLSGGDKVITQGTNNLKSGGPIKAVPASSPQKIVPGKPGGGKVGGGRGGGG